MKPQSNFLKQRICADGLHVFDKNTGLNILVDELSFDQSIWSKAPRQVSIALTNACNLACVHCYAPKTKHSLDYSLLTRWIDDLDANGCLGVGFGGGEPTLYPRFYDVCEHISKQTNLAATITTHGHEFDREFVGKFRDKLNFVRVSMDGVGSTYEDMRGRKFSAFINHLRLISENFSFGINYVVNAETFHDVDSAIEVAEEYSASEFLLLPEVGYGRGNRIDQETESKLKKWVKAYRGKIRLAINESFGAELPLCNPFNRETGARAYAHISADGLLKRNSYESGGLALGVDIMKAIEELNKLQNGEQE